MFICISLPDCWDFTFLSNYIYFCDVKMINIPKGRWKLLLILKVLIAVVLKASETETNHCILQETKTAIQIADTVPVHQPDIMRVSFKVPNNNTAVSFA
jgi:hypothetical protein